jgi:hypothetical protein
MVKEFAEAGIQCDAPAVSNPSGKESSFGFYSTLLNELDRTVCEVLGLAGDDDPTRNRRKAIHLRTNPERASSVNRLPC